MIETMLRGDPGGVPLRLISSLVLLTAVILASVALLILRDLTLARLLFVGTLVIGYSFIVVQWRRQRAVRRQELPPKGVDGDLPPTIQ